MHLTLAGRRSIKTIALTGLVLIMFSATPLHAKIQRFDILVRVSDFFSTLDEIDHLIYTLTNTPQNALKQRLETGEYGFSLSERWVDNTRSVVLGISLTDPRPSLYFLLPIQTPDITFENRFSVIKKKTHYIGNFNNRTQSPKLSRFARESLLRETLSDARGAVSISLPLGEVVNKNEEKIAALTETVELSQSRSDSDSSRKISPEDLKLMLNLAKQVDWYTCDIDFGALDINIRSKFQVNPKSELAGMLGAVSDLSVYAHKAAGINLAALNGILNQLSLEFDRTSQILKANTVIPFHMIRKIGDLLPGIPKPTKPQWAAAPPSAPKEKQTKPPKRTRPSPPKHKPADDPAYWIEKGGAALIYGHEHAAIRYYTQALRLNPRDPETHFQLGISYGEAGDYGQAIASINRAIRMNPDAGAYYYGRGRIHLLAGKTGLAEKDFIRAAKSGSSDARRYLKRR